MGELIIIWEHIIKHEVCYTTRSHNGSFTTQIAKSMGPIWGPPGSCRPQVGPMLAHINFAISVLIEALPGPTYFMVWANVVPVSSTWVATVHISREPKNTRIWRCQCHTSTLHEACHDDVIKWKHFPRFWPFVRGIHRSPVNSLQKGQWRGALIFSLICVWINGWVNNHEAGDLRPYRAHYNVRVMFRERS